MAKITDLPKGVQDAIEMLYDMAEQTLDRGSYSPNATKGPDAWGGRSITL